MVKEKNYKCILTCGNSANTTVPFIYSVVLDSMIITPAFPAPNLALLSNSTAFTSLTLPLSLCLEFLSMTSVVKLWFQETEKSKLQPKHTLNVQWR